MYNKKVGALEEFVLLLVLLYDGTAYSVNLAEEYKNKTGKSISVPAMHTVLRQLELKEFVKSDIGGATSERGGRSKRIYKITSTGYNIIKKIQEERTKLWLDVPKIKFA